MKTLFLEKPECTKKLERILDIKLKKDNNHFILEGEPEEECIAEKIIDALNFGFPFQTAILIKKQNFSIEIISIKNHTRSKNLQRIRARIIGKKGKALKTLTDLTECRFKIKDNHVAILGAPENLHNAEQAIISLVRGTKHANVYSFLEKHHVKPVLDLGLKE